MALIIPVQKLVTEKLGGFNKRLYDACMQEDDRQEPVVITDATLAVADGVPTVILSSEMVEATEEDVGDDVAEGDIVPAGPGIIVQVMQLGAETDKEATSTQERFNAMATRLGGEVLRVSVVTGHITVLVDVREKDAAGKEVIKQLPVSKEVVYVMVVYDAEVAEGEGEEETKGKS